MMSESRVKVSEIIAPVFYPVHRDIKKHLHREYWLMGGRGSTKSSFCASEIIIGMMRDKEANAIVYRKVGATLRDSVYDQLLQVIHRLGVSDYWIPKLSPLEIVYKPTGQRILFRGADDPMKSKSITLRNGYFGFLWFEELAEFKSIQEIITIQASVIRGKGSEKAVTLVSYNPPISASAWVNEEALKQIDDRLYHTSNYLDVPKEWLGDMFIAQADALKKSNERLYRHMYLGEITGTGGNVFENVQIREIPDDEIQTFGMFYQGIDWGFFPDPFQWVRCSFDVPRNTLYIIDEVRLYKCGNADAYEQIKYKVRHDEPLICDSAETKSISDFKGFGVWWATAAKKGAGSVDYSMKWLSALSQIVIDPKRCPNVAKEFSEYEYARDRKGDFIDGYNDADNHAIDAVRYATSMVWRKAVM